MARVKIDQRDPENEEDKELEDEGEDFEVPEPPISLHGSDFLEPKQQPVRGKSRFRLLKCNCLIQRLC